MVIVFIWGYYTMKLQPANTQSTINIHKQNNQILKIYKVKKIGLFGSYAHGQQKEYSDLDFLVEFDLTQFLHSFPIP